LPRTRGPLGKRKIDGLHDGEGIPAGETENELQGPFLRYVCQHWATVEPPFALRGGLPPFTSDRFQAPNADSVLEGVRHQERRDPLDLTAPPNPVGCESGGLVPRALRVIVGNPSSSLQMCCQVQLYHELPPSSELPSTVLSLSRRTDIFSSPDATCVRSPTTRGAADG
jgi:hypothetical protein